MDRRALVVLFAAVALACTNIDLGSPTPAIEPAPTTTVSGQPSGPTGASPSPPTDSPPTPDLFGVRACRYDPLSSSPAQMPPEVVSPAPDEPPVVVQPSSSEVDAETTERQLEVFQGLTDAIADNYIYIDSAALDWAALEARYEALIRGGLTDDDFYLAMDNLMTELGDEHSSFEDPQEVIEADEESSGNASYVGIGVVVQSTPAHDGAVVLVAYPDGPASEAGIVAHDKVLSADGLPILNEDGSVAIERLRGPSGSEVTVSVQSVGSEPRELTIERRGVSGGFPIEYCVVPGTRVGYLLLPTLFDRKIPEKVGEALAAMTAAGPLDGLILDNRINGGGFGSVAEDLLGFFTDGLQGHFVSRAESSELVIEANEIGNSQSVPLVVLVERDTVSFAEIMSGVLQRSGRAQVVGSTTTGNVEILHGYNLEDGSRAWVAYDTFQPIGLDAGAWEETGIVPDAASPTRWDLFTEATDPSFPIALALLESQGTNGSFSVP